MTRHTALAVALLTWAGLAQADEWADCNADAPDRAIRGCSVAIQNGNATPEQLAAAHSKRASAYSRMGRLDQAIADLDEAIRLKPDDAAAYLSRSEAHLKRGEHDKANADLRKATSIQTERINALIERMQPRIEGRKRAGVFGVPTSDDRDGCFADSEHAIRECSLIIEHAGATPKQLADAHFTRGVAHQLKLEFGRAISDYDQTIRLSPGHTLAYINRCSAYSKIGKLDQATLDCDEAVRLTPNTAEAYFARSDVYHRKGMLDEAKADWNKGRSLVKAENDRRWAIIDLFTALAHVRGELKRVTARFEGEKKKAAQECADGNPDLAIRGCTWIIEHRELSPSELGAVYARRGLAYETKQELARAIADFDEAVRLGPNAFEGYYLRGFVYEAMGKRERATTDYRSSLLLDTDGRFSYLRSLSKRGLERLGAAP